MRQKLSTWVTIIAVASSLAACAAETMSEEEQVALASAAVTGKPSDATTDDLESLGFDCNQRDVHTTVCTKCYGDGSCLVYECDRWSGDCTYTVESGPGAPTLGDYVAPVSPTRTTSTTAGTIGTTTDTRLAR